MRERQWKEKNNIIMDDQEDINDKDLVKNIVKLMKLNIMIKVREEKQQKGKEKVTVETMRNASNRDRVYDGEDHSCFESKESSDDDMVRTKKIPRNTRFAPTKDSEDTHLYVNL
ncbi:hypothetical protein ACLOJK_002557 [Asimina triloba]